MTLNYFVATIGATAALTDRDAAAIAEEIFSLYDEIARSDARDRVAGRS